MVNLLVPGGMPTASRVIVIPAGGSLDGLAWPVKDLSETLPRGIDLTGYLGELGATITGVLTLEADPSLSPALLQVTPQGVITLQVSGGSLAVPAPMVALDIALSGGNRIRLVLVQPIESRLPGSLATVGPAPPGGDEQTASILIVA